MHLKNKQNSLLIPSVYIFICAAVWLFFNCSLPEDFVRKISASLSLYCVSFLVSIFFCIMSHMLASRKESSFFHMRLFFSVIQTIHPILGALFLMYALSYSPQVYSYTQAPLAHYIFPSLCLAVPLMFRFFTIAPVYKNLKQSLHFFLGFWFRLFPYWILFCIITEKIFCIYGIGRIVINASASQNMNSLLPSVLVLSLFSLFSAWAARLFTYEPEYNCSTASAYAAIIFSVPAGIILASALLTPSKPVDTPNTLERMLAPNFEYAMGTDELGRDVLGIIKSSIIPEFMDIFLYSLAATLAAFFVSLILKKLNALRFFNFLKPLAFFPAILAILLFFTNSNYPSQTEFYRFYSVFIFLTSLLLFTENMHYFSFFSIFADQFQMFYFGTAAALFCGCLFSSNDMLLGNMLDIALNNLSTSPHMFSSFTLIPLALCAVTHLVLSGLAVIFFNNSRSKS